MWWIYNTLVKIAIVIEIIQMLTDNPIKKMRIERVSHDINGGYLCWKEVYIEFDSKFIPK